MKSLKKKTKKPAPATKPTERGEELCIYKIAALFLSLCVCVFFPFLVVRFEKFTVTSETENCSETGHQHADGKTVGIIVVITSE